MKIAYIYHVIGTLTFRHVRLSLESLSKQQIHWDRFILYNGSDFSIDHIMNYVPQHMFKSVEIFPYDRETPKSATADWYTQMRKISGADRYLSHKADFYLPSWIGKKFENISEKGDWFLLFNKYDMKEGATDDDIRFYANLDWKTGNSLPTTGLYRDHIGRLAIPYHQSWKIDGVMHGYTDGTRQFYNPDHSEIQTRWGLNSSIDQLTRHVPFIKNDEMFAVHMYHDTPDKVDPEKLMAGEKF